MSHGHYKALAIFPLLGILCMSPADMHKKAYFRSIASESFDAIPFPKFTKLAEKIDEKLIIKDHKVSHEDFNKQVADLELKIKEKGASEENVKGILQAQADINKLLTDKVIDSDKGIEGLDKLSALKSQIEKLGEVKAEPKKEVVVVKEAPKKEEPKKEEPKKEVAKKEEKKEEKESDHEDCGNENHKVLTSSIQTLVKDQSAIMQNMMNMMQMMMFMNSQSQMAMNEMKYNNQYQYSNPNSAGNWNYYADRFPMYQPNIFAQQPQQQMQQQQMQQPQTGWNLAPSQQFQFPQVQMQTQMQSPMAMGTGNFSMAPQSAGMGSMGMNLSPYSFNLGV